MKITGTYGNYLNMSSLLSPLGVKSSDVVLQVFTEAMSNLQTKLAGQAFSKESAAALGKLHDKASDVGSKAAKLTETAFDSVFNDRTAASSDGAVVTATAFDAISDDTGAAPAAYNISVAQVAAAQENEGEELNEADSSVVGLGTNTFRITINDQVHDLSIEVAEGDTNEAVLEKLTTAVNGADIGVTAEAVAGSADGTAKLSITAQNTGAANSFSISDLSGNAVSSMGVGSATVEAQDAAFTVDGTAYSSASNTAYIDDGMVTLNLKGTGESVLTVGPDQDKIKNAVSSLVSGINSFRKFLTEKSDYVKDEVLKEIDSFISDHKNEFQSFGITQAESGELQIDNDKLSAAIAGNMSGLKQAFGGFDGFAVQVSSYSSRIKESPLNYAKNMQAGTGNSGLPGMLQVLKGTLLDTYL